MDSSLLSDKTVVDSIAFGMKVSAERILSNSPAQTCSFLRIGVVPGGFMGAVNAILLTEGIFLENKALVRGGFVAQEDYDGESGDIYCDHLGGRAECTAPTSNIDLWRKTKKLEVSFSQCVEIPMTYFYTRDDKWGLRRPLDLELRLSIVWLVKLLQYNYCIGKLCLRCCI